MLYLILLQKLLQKKRDFFYKSHKQIKTKKSGLEADTTRRKCYLYDSMNFLLPHIADRKTAPNQSEPSDEDGGASQVSEASALSTETPSFTLNVQPTSFASPYLVDTIP